VPLYRYEALDRTGNPVVGAMQVPDEQALNARLQAMGYRPTTVQMAQSGGARTLQPAASPHAAPAAGASRLSANERALARMFHQLHISFRAGMPAFQAVSTVSAQVADPAIRQALTEISLGIRDGHLFSGLLERYPRLFSRGDVGMIRAAEMGGFLPEALESIAQRYEQDDNTRRRLRIWIWFFHSNVIGLALAIALAFCFGPMIANMDKGLGALAIGAAASGRAFLFYSLPLLLLYFGAIFYLWRIRHNPAMAYKWHRFLMKIPLAAKINHLRSASVFSRALQQLVHAGVVGTTAWETAADAVPNRYLSEQLQSARPAVAATARFSPAMQQVGLFDAADIGMVATGESTGEIAQALQYLANRYEEDTRVALGAAVVRGAVSFVTWAFLVGAIATVALAQGYFGQIFPAVEKFMGVGE
jgi:type II secretory pathway component PulF